MAKLTSPEELEALRDLLRRQADLLDDEVGGTGVRQSLRREVAATGEHWHGRVADCFRRHTGPEHRQHHLHVAAYRLRAAARAADEAAQEARQARARRNAASQTGGGVYGEGEFE
ncbi:MAG: hypothetical protein ACRDT4_27780 [Micromonosporaceae bacterium]